MRWSGSLCVSNACALPTRSAPLAQFEAQPTTSLLVCLSSGVLAGHSRSAPSFMLTATAAYSVKRRHAFDLSCAIVLSSIFDGQRGLLFRFAATFLRRRDARISLVDHRGCPDRDCLFLFF